MSRKTAAGMYDKMDSLIQAINRLAESQEKANAVMAKNYEMNRRHYELSIKQFNLNWDNHQFNREQAEKAEESAKQEREDLTKVIKEYIDNNIDKVHDRIHEHQVITRQAHKKLEVAIEAKADKADEKELAEKVSKGLLKSLRPKGFIK